MLETGARQSWIRVGSTFRVIEGMDAYIDRHHFAVFFLFQKINSSEVRMASILVSRLRLLITLSPKAKWFRMLSRMERISCGSMSLLDQILVFVFCQGVDVVFH